ncbi:unnamed protein product [marine sediment metagenome]|uniref:Uncharacterized protein n=1 Tax=marine sediment metagenome TaxID=412755 RepID=X1QPY1_9ZZZZ
MTGGDETDNCWICGAKLENPIRQYCAKCYDKMLVERERKEDAAIAAYLKMEGKK